jgi:UDP-MurNAc hydroxylase
MRATSFGHACWLLETSGGRVLTDPVLSDPFEGGTVTACPSRQFLTDTPPDYDVLYISHRHLDHFHAPTLRRLPRDKPVLSPQDRWTLRALEELGFTQIVPMTPFEPYTLEGPAGTAEIIPLPSISETFLEHGALFVDRPSDGPVRSLLNQVDVALPNEVIDRVHAIVGRLDVHLAMYASQAFGWFAGLPEDPSESYTQNLHAAVRTQARLVVPASAGFRFVDDYAFLNQKLFPISVGRFMRDCRRLLPGVDIRAVNPGDRIDIGDTITIAEGVSTEVAMAEDDTHLLRFDPTAPSPPVVDLNGPGYPLEVLHGFAEAVLERGLVAYLQAAVEVGEEAAAVYAEHEATYAVDVVFPDRTRSWSFRFHEGGVEVARDAPVVPDAMWRITASALLDICEGKRGCWSVRPESRKSGQLLVANRSASGVTAMQVQLPCLLTNFILNMRIRMVGEDQALLQYYGLLDS